VTGVRFPVRVDKVGRQTMTVKGTGATVSDAVARSVLVVPDGQSVPVAASGTLGAGTITNTVNFPAAAVAGSQQLTLNVYPAYLSQVVGGMDSLLRVPSGCFEQTTSTAWPNVRLAASKGTDGAVGSLGVAVDGAGFTTLALTADQADVMTTVDLSTLASTGKHDVTLTFVGTGNVSYNLVAQHNVPWASNRRVFPRARAAQASAADARFRALTRSSLHL
jgi:hypothetical protein